MDTRVAIISIIVRDVSSVETLNALLHEYRQYIIGRMGIPYKPKGVCLINVSVDAPQDEISALSGKIGSLQGVTTKTLFSDI